MPAKSLSVLLREKERIEREGFVADCWIAAYRPAGKARGDNTYHRLESRVPFLNGRHTRHLKPGEVPVFRRLVENGRALKRIEREIAVLQGLKRTARAVLSSSASDEWYTPPEVVDLARQVLGGIDVDPASNATAQSWVRAGTFYTVEDDGLAQPWRGRLWLNPPYGAQIGRWTERAAAAFDAGEISAGVLLVRPAPGSAWYQALAGRFASCTPHRRIRFIDAHGRQQASPVHGNVFFYLGEEVERFRTLFGAIGVIARPW